MADITFNANGFAGVLETSFKRWQILLSMPMVLREYWKCFKIWHTCHGHDTQQNPWISQTIASVNLIYFYIHESTSITVTTTIAHYIIPLCKVVHSRYKTNVLILVTKRWLFCNYYLMLLTKPLISLHTHTQSHTNNYSLTIIYDTFWWNVIQWYILQM